MLAEWDEPPAAPEGVGYYELDGIPVVLWADRGPETVYGQPVDWGEWLYRSSRISREEFDARVGMLTPPDTPRR